MELKRRKPTTNSKRSYTQKDLVIQTQVIADLQSRARIASLMGKQYNGDRDIYAALGYPTEEQLDFDWFNAHYERQDIASAIIDRPVDKTWDGQIAITEADTPQEDSSLAKQWKTLLDNKSLKIKKNLVRFDKLASLGEYALLLFGFNDVKETTDFNKPLGGKNLKLIYLRPINQPNASIKEWETDTSNERYGMPKTYDIKVGIPGRTGESQSILVHHSRVLHLATGSLTSDVYGRPRLKPIANRLVDLEKIIGGDAEMFWRGARPGYTALSKDDYEMGDEEIDKLHEELDKYEHDLRRFITAQGVDITALTQQVSDPANHVDIVIQAISAQTGIPKRIIVGSERGELSSGQDKDQWLSLVKTRMEEFAEPEILRPFIDKCMEVGVITKVVDYNVMWDDLFAPSDKEKAEIGSVRATALKTYSDSPYASDFMPPTLAYKYILGLSEEQVEEITQDVDVNMIAEERAGKKLEEEARLLNPQPVAKIEPVDLKVAVKHNGHHKVKV